MKLHRWNFGLLLAGVAMATLGFTGVAGAQTDAGAPPPPPPGGMHRGAGPGGPGGPEDEIRFVGFEMGLEGKTVTGAPFTATFSTQFTQTLSDGNKISTTTTGTIARDSQGRTRRDMTLPAIGPWATAGGNPPHVIFLNDPVAGTHYVLDPNRKVARQVPMDRLHNRDMRAQTFSMPDRGRKGANLATADLGTQTINGVSAQGTRYTRTIPAGAIGNEKPIEVVTEIWYSPDLQINVEKKHSDPRNGDTVTQLTEIQKQEPDATLFQVPSDYTLRQGKRGARPARPANPPSDSQ
jgi:hypothetical protein